MINLLGTQQKEEIRAARLNVQLRKYALLSFFVFLGILAVYGVGFYLVETDRAHAEEQLSRDTATSNQYDSVKKEAKTYKSNLTIAKKVLSSGLSYSTFLTEAAHSLPPGSVLTDITLTDLGATTGTAANAATSAITLHARTTDYATALKVKDSLEASPLFENVHITNVQQDILTDASTARQKQYPFTLNVNISITKQK